MILWKSFYLVSKELEVFYISDFPPQVWVCSQTEHTSFLVCWCNWYYNISTAGNCNDYDFMIDNRISYLNLELCYEYAWNTELPSVKGKRYAIRVLLNTTDCLKIKFHVNYFDQINPILFSLHLGSHKYVQERALYLPESLIITKC